MVFKEGFHQVFESVIIVFAVILAFLTLVGVVSLHPASYAAVVNGEGISSQEVLDTYEQLPEHVRATYSVEDVLEQLIDKALVLQEAERVGIRVSQEEVDVFIDEQVAIFGISRRQLADTLAQAGISFSEYEQAVYEELVLRAFVQQEIGEVDNPSEEFQRIIARLREEARIEYGEL